MKLSNLQIQVSMRLTAVQHLVLRLESINKITMFNLTLLHRSLRMYLTSGYIYKTLLRAQTVGPKSTFGTPW